MPYRKKQGSDIWHWYRNCSNWPRVDFDGQLGKPSTGSLCSECQARESDGILSDVRASGSVLATIRLRA